MAEKINELLERGVDKIYPSRKELEQVLRSGRKLKLYQGFDPTGERLHLGHMVGLRKLRQWQDLGHEVIFLIGDGTGQAGDPSGKAGARDKFHTQAELRANAKDYVIQARKIVAFDGENPAKILYNGDWLNKLTLVDILNIADYFTLAQLSERDLFRERAKKGEQVSLREFLYPVLQAYDSVAMEVDLEQGGSDQTFNMLSGRHLVKAMQKREKFVLTTPLIADASGKKIGKTEGNAIALIDAPENLYGKIMALPDEVMPQCFECLTSVPAGEIENKDPLTNKKRLAFEIVKDLNDAQAAAQAQTSWENTFSKGVIAEDMFTQVKENSQTLAEILLQTKLVPSKSEFRRLLDAGAVTELTTGEKIKDYDFKPKNGQSFRIGGHRFLKIT